MKDLRKIVENANKELVENHCGSMDAMNDPEWAKEEGIPVIELTMAQLEELSMHIDISRLSAEELYNLSKKIN